MSFDRLLPNLGTVSTVSETVVDGRRQQTVSEVATGVRFRVVERAPADVIFDPEGEIVTDADLLTRHPVELGQIVALDDGRTFVISDRPNALQAARTVHHYAAPARTGTPETFPPPADPPAIPT